MKRTRKGEARGEWRPSPCHSRSHSLCPGSLAPSNKSRRGRRRRRSGSNLSLSLGHLFLSRCHRRPHKCFPSKMSNHQQTARSRSPSPLFAFPPLIGSFSNVMHTYRTASRILPLSQRQGGMSDILIRLCVACRSVQLERGLLAIFVLQQLGRAMGSHLPSLLMVEPRRRRLN